MCVLCNLCIWQLLTRTTVRHEAAIPSPRRSVFFPPTSARSLDQVFASPIRADGEGFPHMSSVPISRPTIETRTHRLAKSESFAAAYVMSPVDMYCTGHCRETNQEPYTSQSPPRAEVVRCLSRSMRVVLIFVFRSLFLLQRMEKRAGKTLQALP